MVELLIRARIASGKRSEFLQSLQSLLRLDDAGTAMGEFVIFEAMSTPNEFLVAERWASDNALRAYLGSDAFKALVGAIRVLGSLRGVQVIDERSTLDSPNQPI